MPPLRIAILLETVDGLAGWERRLFDKIASDARFLLAGIIHDGRPGKRNTRGRALGNAGSWTARTLFSLVSKAEEKVYVRRPADCGAVFAAAVAKVPAIYVFPQREARCDRFSEVDSEEVRALGADVILRHGLATVAGPIIGAARFGIWSLEHDGGGLLADPFTGFRETFDRLPTTAVTLSVQNRETPQGAPLARAAFNTDRVGARNRFQTGERAVGLVWRELRRLALRGKIEPDPSQEQIPLPKAPMAPPSVADSLSYGRRFATAIARAAGARVKRMAGGRTNMWSLQFGKGALDAASLAATSEVWPSRGEFWADPFILTRNGEHYVFFENFVYATGLGKISVGRYSAQGFEVLGDALDLPYHLSFPLVFEHEGEIFMVPESCAAKRVDVWRAVEFPLRWELYATALEGVSAADTVLFQDNGKWWMFTNISDGPLEDHCNELHVFSIDGPGLLRVTPHPLNPVVIGSSTARGAGRIVRRGTKLVRPSQNNANGIYGWGLNLMEITRLDMDGYEERRIVSFAPNFKPGLIGIHHFDSSGDLFVIDTCRPWG